MLAIHVQLAACVLLSMLVPTSSGSFYLSLPNRRGIYAMKEQDVNYCSMATLGLKDFVLAIMLQQQHCLHAYNIDSIAAA